MEFSVVALSSVSWLMASSYTGMDLYDCCILAVRSSEKTLLMPACRVLAGRIDAIEDMDPELSTSSRFLPKGVSNDGKSISWWFWIPCSDSKWLWYNTPWAQGQQQELGIRGKKSMVVNSGKEVTALLESGELLISMSSVKEVEGVIETSRSAAGILKDMLLGRPAY